MLPRDALAIERYRARQAKRVGVGLAADGVEEGEGEEEEIPDRPPLPAAARWDSSSIGGWLLRKSSLPSRLASMPKAVPMSAVDPEFEVAAERPNPFGVLAGLKTGKPQ